MRGKSIAIAAVAVLAIGAVPAFAKESNALRSAPRTVVAPKPAPTAPIASQPVSRPAVWIPTTTRGIKWSGVKYAVWIR